MTAPTETTPAAATCPRCGAPLRADQDWCLMCGTAVTTHVAGTSGWRTPLAIVGVVLALAAVVLVVAFLELSDDADQVAQAPTPAPTEAPPAPTPTPTPPPNPSPTPSPSASPSPSPGPSPSPSPSPGAGPTATPTPGSGGSGSFAGWPAGRTAWTVVLASTTTRADAESRAKGFQQKGAASLGILDSDDFKSLRGGFFVVFSGQYDSQDQAQDAADGLKSTAPDAYARRIEPR